METDLAALIAKKFIQRRDAKAQQTPDGAWHPVRERAEDGTYTGPNIPWKMRDLRDHIAGTKTFGNYMLDQDNKVKLFVLDLDLDKVGTYAVRPDPADPKYWNEDGTPRDNVFDSDVQVIPSTPRVDWLDRRHPGRPWYKLQLRELAELISIAIEKELNIPTAVAYTGSKGLHVYGFTGETDASRARAGALLALEATALIAPVPGDVTPVKGKNFFKFTNDNPNDCFSNITVEVFPKQDSADGYGNLVRLPLGRNLKNPKDPCFFIDHTAPLTVMRPHPDPVRLLNEGL